MENKVVESVEKLVNKNIEVLERVEYRIRYFEENNQYGVGDKKTNDCILYELREIQKILKGEQQ